MKEYRENQTVKFIFASFSFLMCLVFMWMISSMESMFVVLCGFAMLGLFLYLFINPFFHKIILADDYIEERTLLGKKQIFFKDVTHINVQSFFSEIRNEKKKIQIGKYTMQNSDEIIGTVFSKIKGNQEILFAGDPILFQSYVNDFSENKKLREYNEHNLPDFTFIENSELVEKKWLFRKVNLKTSKGTFDIIYFGKGMGYECVFVNDELVSKKDNSYWYVPKFDFNYQGMNFSVNVRVYPWMTIRRFWIEVDGKIVYSE